jgi:hypothetical protein
MALPSVVRTEAGQSLERFLTITAAPTRAKQALHWDL